MKAIQGGKAKNDKINAHKIAGLLGVACCRWRTSTHRRWERRETSCAAAVIAYGSEPRGWRISALLDNSARHQQFTFLLVAPQRSGHPGIGILHAAIDKTSLFACVPPEAPLDVEGSPTTGTAVKVWKRRVSKEANGAW
jgi:hypothetical protein